MFCGQGQSIIFTFSNAGIYLDYLFIDVAFNLWACAIDNDKKGLNTMSWIYNYHYHLIWIYGLATGLFLERF